MKDDLGELFQRQDKTVLLMHKTPGPKECGPTPPQHVII